MVYVRTVFPLINPSTRIQVCIYSMCGCVGVWVCMCECLIVCLFVCVCVCIWMCMCMLVGVVHLTTSCTLQCVYVAPLKALVRERVEDWKVRIEQNLGKR